MRPGMSSFMARIGPVPMEAWTAAVRAQVRNAGVDTSAAAVRASGGSCLAHQVGEAASPPTAMTDAGSLSSGNGMRCIPDFGGAVSMVVEADIRQRRYQAPRYDRSGPRSAH